MISIFYLTLAVICALAADGSGNKRNNLWITHIKGGEELAKVVARDVGLTYRDKGIGKFKDHDVMVREEHPEVDVDEVTRRLLDHQHAMWARQQVISDKSIYHLSERDDNQNFDDDKEQVDIDWFLKTIKETPEFQNCKTGTFACSELSPHLLAYLKYLGQTDVKKLGTISTEPAYTTTLSTYEGATKHLSQDPKQLSAYAVRFSDPNWRKQWYVQDYRTDNYPVMDHNVVPIYFKELSNLEQDLTGFTVTVGVLGDGVKEHPDLGENYVESISYDFCTDQKGATPAWRRTGYWFATGAYDTLGTSSAGVIAMQANNDLCGVGIAPKARIAGIRMSGCDNHNKNIEANALKYNLDDIDIYCNTWTNDDELGNKLVEMSYTVESALKLGTSKGRNHKGAIYIFPSGSNRRLINCATNGYVNNPYVITIASAASDGKYSVYTERCPAVFASAYSGDKSLVQDVQAQDVYTISPEGGCAKYPTDKPVGPAVAAGIFALVLQYKPSLTYRDMMHLVAMTAEVAPLADTKHSWHRNGRGFWVSNDYGFGLLNAKNMINMAKDWQTVPEKRICVLTKKFDVPVYFDNSIRQEITLDGSECNVGDKKINYLEHVELVSTFYHSLRGQVYINVTSPAKTNTEMLEPRDKDNYNGVTRDWSIMSVHNWGESPHGIWEITVMSCRFLFKDNQHGHIHELTLKLHGTEQKPAHYNQARNYAAFRLPNGDTNMFV